jgi:diadenosine tetraphosphate (Ap4A) HIT family hydrolase
MWNFLFHLLACLDHARAFGELVPNAVDLHIHKIGRWRGGNRGGGFSESGHERRGKKRKLFDYRSARGSGNPIL